MNPFPACLCTPRGGWNTVRMKACGPYLAHKEKNRRGSCCSRPHLSHLTSTMRPIVTLRTVVSLFDSFFFFFFFFFTISSEHRELSPTSTLRWPGQNRAQITCSTWSAYHVQHVVCHVVRRDNSAVKGKAKSKVMLQLMHSMRKSYSKTVVYFIHASSVLRKKAN